MGNTALGARTDQAQQWLGVLSDHVLEHGLCDVSLRGLAAVAGTSHRMLSYYFGSLDGLLGSIADELRRRRMEALTATTTTRRELLERAWDTARTDEARIVTQIFFRLAGRAIATDQEAEQVIDPFAPDWNAAIVAAGVAEGLSFERATTEARLLSAAGHGLLLAVMTGADATQARQALHLLLDLTCGRPDA